jgi:SAM-dependent methyltransferase
MDDVIGWDAENWSRSLEYWQSQSEINVQQANCLELGSHHGGLSLWLALHGAKVTCSDLALPGELAHQLHLRYGISRQVEYGALDAKNLPYTDHFDVLCFKSVLGALGSEKDQEKAIHSMWKALRPGGELWFAENLLASPAHAALRSRFIKWGQRWRYVTVPEMRKFLAPFSTVTLTTVGVLGTLGRTERQRRAMARLDRCFVESLVPSSWRYIVIGVARK